MHSTRYSSYILMKLEFPRQIFEKLSNTKFHVNPPTGRRICSMRTGRRTDRDRHDEANSHILRFFKRA
jgi:hypothetical protein